MFSPTPLISPLLLYLRQRNETYRKKKREKRDTTAFEFQMCWILKLMYVFIHLRAASMCACIRILSAAMKRCVEGSFSPPRLLSPRQSAVICKQTQRGKLCMRTGFRQPYLFYVNTFSIRNQLCVFVTLCAHAPASPRRSYLLECVQMCCCWWSAAFAEQQQKQCWSVCRAGGGFGSNLQCNQNIGRGQGRSRSVQSENPLTHWSGAL